ncbi:XRE family transcriptional regulator [uncultured Anaeromusa sp.]|uniref:helix-turn-helix domain-containing protein n=1 Tax=uncultured Anaeromusa sp. TaxID=673273 RepID=UPI0029C804D5|nr:XRE family transcriptional regulator [uncultured Anaeromusa sp.]
MNNLNEIISQNVIRLRKEKNFSFDKLAESSGVSKALLCQIERGDSNPTINTLWKIAVGLGVALGDLLETHEYPLEIVRKKSKTPLIDNEAGLRLWPVFSNSFSPVGIFIAELDSMHTHDSTPHDAYSNEYVFVIEGALIVTINGRSSHLSQGDTLFFRADQPHHYYNPASTTTHFQCIYHRK